MGDCGLSTQQYTKWVHAYTRITSKMGSRICRNCLENGFVHIHVLARPSYHGCRDVCVLAGQLVYANPHQRYTVKQEVVDWLASCG